MREQWRAAALLTAAAELRESLNTLHFGAPVTHVYNPLHYAWDMHEAYVQRYVHGPIEALFVGMNPGPWGMAQTGIPFGEVGAVGRYLGLNAPITAATATHPKRPVQGLACRRIEVSGLRLWGLIAQKFPSPEDFFARHFVANYCPLMFLEASGRNRTPAQLSARERAPLQQVCDRHLQRMVDILSPNWVVGVGHYAHACSQRALGSQGFKLARITHPSPASPAANRDWAATVLRELVQQGVCQPDKFAVHTQNTENQIL